MKRAFALLLALGLLALPASAALTLTLAPAAQNAARGTELVFTGTLTNTSATDKVWLNDIQASLQGSAAAYVVLKTNDFFAHVPGILLPGEIYTGPLFRLALGSGAPAGDYAGTIVLAGGADIFATGTLASAGLTVLSPDVTILATDASASEFGPDAGTFTVRGPGERARRCPFPVRSRARPSMAPPTPRFCPRSPFPPDWRRRPLRSRRSLIISRRVIARRS